MNIQTRIALLTTQINRLYAANEFCQHEYEIAVLEEQLQQLKTRLAQKPKTKNSVVCVIASKLAKQGIKNPMRISWLIHRLTIATLDSIKLNHLNGFQKCRDMFRSLATRLNFDWFSLLPENCQSVIYKFTFKNIDSLV